MLMVQVPHPVHMGCTNPNENITIAFLGKNYPKSIYGMSNFEFGTNVKKNKNYRGLFQN